MESGFRESWESNQGLERGLHSWGKELLGMLDQEMGSKRKNSDWETLQSATGGKENNPPEGCRQTQA